MKLSSNITYNQPLAPSKKPCTKKENQFCTNNFADFKQINSYFLPNFNGLFYKKVDFQKAKTIKEAEQFGQNSLDVVRYCCFDDRNLLGVMNYINEGLAQAYNITKGKIKMPISIKASSLDLAFASMNYMNGTLEINKNKFSADNIDNAIDTMFNSMLRDKVILIDDNDDYVLNPLLANEESSEFFEKVNNALIQDPSDLSYDEKLELMLNLRIFYTKTSIMNYFPVDLIVKMLKSGCFGEIGEKDISEFESSVEFYPQKSNFSHLFDVLSKNHSFSLDFDLNTNKFDIIFHELGHLQSRKLADLPSITDYKNPKDYPNELLEWINNPENLKIACKVSPYACCGASEFVAEVYSKLLAQKELPSDVLELYNKLKGPKIKKIED